MTYSTHAIILRRRDIGEWDRLYTVYTRDYGKLSLIAKGTRRPKAKLAAHLEPYSEVDLVIARGRAVDRIVFARVITSGSRLASAWEQLQVAAFGVECVDQLTREAHRDAAVFDLLHDILRTLSSMNSSLFIHHSSLTIPFTLRLLSILGYAPRLDRCLECRGLPGPAAVAGIPQRGGFVCHRCRMSETVGMPLTGDDLSLLERFCSSFAPEPCPPSAALFVFALLESHLVTPLRTLTIGAPILSR